MKKRAISDTQKEARRRALLDAALEQFNLHGYSETGVSKITKAADLSTGTFYLYFKTKAEIFSYLYNEAILILMPDFAKIADMPGGSYMRLLAIGEVYKRLYTDHYHHFRVLAILHINQDVFQDEKLPINEEIDANAKKLLGYIQKVLEDGMAAGELKELDSWATTTILWGMIDSFFIMQERKSLEFAGLEFEEVFNTGFALFSTGLFKLPGEATDK